MPFPPDEPAANAARTAPLPRVVWIELTSRWPYDCPFCSRRTLRGHGENMPLAIDIDGERAAVIANAGSEPRPFTKRIPLPAPAADAARQLLERSAAAHADANLVLVVEQGADDRSADGDPMAEFAAVHVVPGAPGSGGGVDPRDAAGVQDRLARQLAWWRAVCRPATVLVSPGLPRFPGGRQPR